MKVLRLGVVIAAVGMSAMTSGCASYGDFTLSSVDGQEVSLGDHKGKVVLVTFWGST